VQIGSALASGIGQRIRMPESRLKILVACGAAGGIAATFNAPITGVFFGVEIILRAFSVEAIFTVMLSAMVADVIAQAFDGSAPFLSGFPAGIAMHHLSSYLLIALLAVVAALIGLAFKAVLYKTEDLCDQLWQHRPEWAGPRPAGSRWACCCWPSRRCTAWLPGHVQGRRRQLRSVVPDRPGRGEDDRDQPDHRHRRVRRGIRAVAVIGATSGMAFGEIAHHLLGAAAGQPALYAVVGMGAVFTSAARAPLTSLASVVEMTGDFSLTLPVMLAVAIATAASRGLSYGTIYTTKLLRRGTDIDRPAPADVLADMTVGDAMRPLEAPPPAVDVGLPALPGMTVQGRDVPDSLLATESLQHALRQLTVHGRDGLPVLDPGSGQLRGWVASHDVLQALTSTVTAAETADARAGVYPGDDHAGLPRLPGPGSHSPPRRAGRRPPARRHGVAARLDPGIGPGRPRPAGRRARPCAAARRPGQPACPEVTGAAARAGQRGRPNRRG